MRFLAVPTAALMVALSLAACTQSPGGGPPVSTSRSAAVPSGPFVATFADGSLADLSLLDGLPVPIGEQRPIGARSFEPTIGVTSSGAIFMVAFGGGARIRASFDEGATWRQVNPDLPEGGVNNPPNSNDPFVYVDRVAGRVFTSDLQALLCSWMNFSDDEGRTWTSNPIGCGQPIGAQDHQSVASGKSRTGESQWKGRVVYYCVNRVGDTSCASSMDGGVTFGPLVTVFLGAEAPAGGVCGGLSGHVKTDHAGRVFVAKDQCGVPSVGVSEDDGKTWRTYAISRSVGIRGHDVEIAADEEDNVYAFWIADDGLPVLAVSRDHGRTFGAPMEVAAPGLTAAGLPAVAAAGPGKVAFAYVGTNRTGGFASSGADWSTAKWHGFIGFMLHALDAKPVILTTWMGSPEDPLAVQQCIAGVDDRCNGMGDFIDLTIDPKGRPWAAFVDVCHEACRSSNRNETSQGVVGTLRQGPSLLSSGGALPRLVPLPGSGSGG